MQLKVGELAKRCGLTVRTLHHYDHIGLVKPSARSESGYRLYDRRDIARLHQVQALQRLGLPLADIGAVLDNPATQLPEVIARQLQMLADQIVQATRLRDRLTTLQLQLRRGEDPDLSEWLTTLELMTMHDKHFTKYFTPDELKRLPANLADQATHPEWAALIKRVNALMDSHTPTNAPAAREVARDWFTVVDRDINGDPTLLAKFTDMHAKEPEIQQRSGVTPAMVQYIQQASIHDKLDLYKPYLSAQEYAFVQANYGQHITEWPPLIADAYQAMQSGAAATSESTLAIARRWLALSRAMYGPDPATVMKVRTAHEREPALLKGSLISPELLDYLRQSFAALHPTS